MVYLEGCETSNATVFLNCVFKVGDQDFSETAEPITLKF